MAGIAPGQNVLDVGSGVVGPARRIASEFGALIWGVELSAPLYQTAVQFTILTGLQDQVNFKQGRALALPFKDGKFDVVTMASIAIQISEKGQLFGECRRVLKVDGRLAMHEIFGGPGGPPRCPLAWATAPDMSSLETLENCLARLRGLGFEVGPFIDLSEDGRKYHEGNVNSFKGALAEGRGAQGLSEEVIIRKLETALSIESN